MKFHEKLQTLRTMKNLSQQELAEKIHVSPEDVARWEKGGESPDLRQMVLLSDCFDITFEQLNDDGFVPGEDPLVTRREIRRHRLVLGAKWVFLLLCCILLIAFVAHLLGR